jgi:large subunit ribosomal protein L25
VERVQLRVRPREASGTKAARQMRAQGDIPGVMYGGDIGSRPIAVNGRDLRHAVTEAGIHAIFDVALDGDGAGTSPAMIKEIQRDPVRDRVTHVDLQIVRMDRPIQGVVMVHLTGDAAGVREGGSLSQPVHEISVEGLPARIPAEIEVDISELEMGASMSMAQVALPDGVTLVGDADSIVVATITTPISEAELEGEPTEVEEAAEEALEEARLAEETPAEDADAGE